MIIDDEIFEPIYVCKGKCDTAFGLHWEEVKI